MNILTQWLTLVTTLPARNTTARMRLWRAAKALGATTLRDGVYLLPSLESTTLIVWFDDERHIFGYIGSKGHYLIYMEVVAILSQCNVIVVNEVGCNLVN